MPPRLRLHRRRHLAIVANVIEQENFSSSVISDRGAIVSATLKEQDELRRHSGLFNAVTSRPHTFCNSFLTFLDF